MGKSSYEDLKKENAGLLARQEDLQTEINKINMQLTEIRGKTSRPVPGMGAKDHGNICPGNLEMRLRSSGKSGEEQRAILENVG